MILFTLITLSCISAADNNATAEIIAQDTGMNADEIVAQNNDINTEKILTDEIHPMSTVNIDCKNNELVLE